MTKIRLQVLNRDYPATTGCRNSFKFCQTFSLAVQYNYYAYLVGKAASGGSICQAGPNNKRIPSCLPRLLSTRFVTVPLQNLEDRRSVFVPLLELVNLQAWHYTWGRVRKIRETFMSVVICGV
ncbi:predicted protein [Sclerotinia sclerotiorum 1980 UF-70]|uniref:Uncharacterized protein n=1 Tax=Sclerotinia sclerotiorum (strain ATCC 18683 / 1980 / Ss-1) TaxID=665079 RepID=A7ETE8_SCLS1|nr:predicted protein [Sclerotinia sclerotiorum 1980 UF-70]EDN92740.1 predicted protein [Sclerotinia sclerotiorum 1980 UF-70]